MPSSSSDESRKDFEEFYESLVMKIAKGEILLDDRNDPNKNATHRKTRFTFRWNKAKRREKYPNPEKTLKELTWANIGYRYVEHVEQLNQPSNLDDDTRDKLWGFLVEKYGAEGRIGQRPAQDIRQGATGSELSETATYEAETEGAGAPETQSKLSPTKLDGEEMKTKITFAQTTDKLRAEFEKESEYWPKNANDDEATDRYWELEEGVVFALAGGRNNNEEEGRTHHIWMVTDNENDGRLFAKTQWKPSGERPDYNFLRRGFRDRNALKIIISDEVELDKVIGYISKKMRPSLLQNQETTDNLISDEQVLDESSPNRTGSAELPPTISQSTTAPELPESVTDEAEDEAAPETPPILFPTYEDGDEGASEGNPILKVHRERERDRTLPNEKKKAVFQQLGHLKCEVCEFDFLEFYGEVGRNCIECHHTLPVSQMPEGGHRTRLEDLALVCANCHWMLHRGGELMTIEKLRDTITNR